MIILRAYTNENNYTNLKIKDTNELQKLLESHDEMDKEECYMIDDELVIDTEWIGETDFEQWVADWMDDNPENIRDVLEYGCINGTVSDLTYTDDIQATFDGYQEDIFNKMNEIVENYGSLPNNFEYNPTNITWMVFEETIRDALHALELEDI